MQIFKTPLSPADLATIAQTLRDGGIVLLPTDTVYGIAAHPDRPEALARILALKGRDPAKPVQLLAGSVEAVAATELQMTPAARRVAEKFWPGALTLVMRKPDGSTEGVRVPNDETACQICLAAGGMLRCTSANPSGEPPALDANAARCAIPEADILVDGGRVKGGHGSTVARIDENGLHIFRHGPISETALRAAAGRDA